MKFDDRLKTTYCTPEDVADTLDMPDPNNPMGIFAFSDVSHPSYDQVCKMIRANEDIIDRRLRRSWRENQVKNYICDIENYQWDEGGYRAAYYMNGGDYIQLRKDIRRWDPSKGDKLEIRSRQNTWIDISNYPVDGEEPTEGNTTSLGDTWRVWFDYSAGKMYIRTRWFQQRFNGVRISYRYGTNSEDPTADDYEPMPDGIARLCCLMTATQVLNMSMFYIKLGSGGDINGVRDALLYNWQEEMGTIWSAFQRSGTVHSMYR